MIGEKSGWRRLGGEGLILTIKWLCTKWRLSYSSDPFAFAIFVCPPSPTYYLMFSIVTSLTLDSSR